MQNYFASLNQVNVSAHIERKGAFAYLSWPFAVAQLRLADPQATWEVRRFAGLPYLKSDCGYFVEVAVTVQGVTLSQIHPVLDARNDPIAEPTSFDINTSIQRCLVKAIALHGLGLYIYAGRGSARHGEGGPQAHTTSAPREAVSPATAGVSPMKGSGRASQHQAARDHPQSPHPLRHRRAAGARVLPGGEAGGHRLRRVPAGDAGDPEREECRMSAILKLVQGTPEWHAHRAKSRNASETPVVLGVSPWQTPYELWQVRSGRNTAKVTPPMRRGTELEPAARRAYEALTGHVMEPLVLAEGEYSASLDGITLDGSLILEVKCPVKGQDSDLWKAVAAGTLPEHYTWQVQHQLMVSGARLAHVFVFDGTVGTLLEVAPDPGCWGRIQEAWDAFMRHLETDTPPPLTDRDTRERSDPAWQQAAEAYLAAKRAAEAASAELDAAKAALVDLTSHPSESGCGVQVTRYWKAGNIDYKKIPELKEVDLEEYRGAGRFEVRVSVK